MAQQEKMLIILIKSLLINCMSGYATIYTYEKDFHKKKNVNRSRSGQSFYRIPAQKNFG